MAGRSGEHGVPRASATDSDPRSETMEIGKPKRKYTIEPIEDPVRRTKEAPPPAREPERVPRPVPTRTSRAEVPQP